MFLISHDKLEGPQVFSSDKLINPLACCCTLTHMALARPPLRQMVIYCERNHEELQSCAAFLAAAAANAAATPTSSPTYLRSSRA